MRLEELGYNETLEQFRIQNNLDGFEVARVIAEHRERYIVRSAQGEYEAEITGNMRFTAKSREDFPAIGDWVTLITYDPDLAIIHHIFPRSSIIKRQAVGQFGEIQIIAANIDVAFLVQAVDRDFSINRLERFLTICNTSGVKPVIVLTKIDMTDEAHLNAVVAGIKERIMNVPVISVSNETRQGFDELQSAIEKGKTYCMLGSSGVGKSTLLNNLSGRIMMRTDHISLTTKKGRHVTSHRELIVLDNSGILIDNPGMREVGIADLSNGLELTFDMIVQLAQHCRFKDCTHMHESGCAVIEAVSNGEIDGDSYENFVKMKLEKEHFESSVAERRNKDKQFGKMVRNYKKDMGKQ